MSSELSRGLWPSESGQRVAGRPCFTPEHYAQARNRPPPAARDPWRARGAGGRRDGGGAGGFSSFQWRFSARRHTHRHVPPKKLRPGTYQLAATYASSNGYDPVTTAKKKFVVTR